MTDSKTADVLEYDLTDGQCASNVRKSAVSKIMPVLLIFALILLLEATVFQYRYFHPLLVGAERRTVGIGSTALSGDVTVSGDTAAVSGRAVIVIANPDDRLTCVTPVTNGNAEYTLTATWSDEASPSSKTAGMAQAMHGSTRRGGDYYLTTHGKCEQLILTVDAHNKPVYISQIKLNAPTYDIRWLRVIIFSLVATAVYAVSKKKPWQKSLSPVKASHTVNQITVIIGAVYIAIMTAIFLLSPGMETNTEHCSVSQLTYAAPDRNDAYMMQTDALSKGQAYLDITPSRELLMLDNPYDKNARKGIKYTWDFAFFDGKYYSYFGIVPVVLVLLPFKLITGMYLSSYVFAFLLGISAAAVLCLVYREAVRRFFPSVSVSAYACGLVALLSCSFLAYAAARSWFYEIPYNSSLLCIFISLYSALKYDRVKRKGLALSSSGLAYGLSVGCRPIALISILLIAPIVIDNIKRTAELKLKIIHSACFAAPCAVVGILLAVWNFIRFGSVTDFGNAYQLTVSDIRYNSALDLPITLDGVTQYLFGEVKIDGVFPFVHSVSAPLVGMSHSMYSMPVSGIMCYPLFWCIGLTPLVIRRGAGNKALSAFIICGILTAVTVVLGVAAAGGVHERYTLDFRWILALISVMTALKFINDRGENDASFNLAFAAAVAVSAAMSLAICMMGEFSRIAKVSEEFYLIMRDTFEILY